MIANKKQNIVTTQINKNLIPEGLYHATLSDVFRFENDHGPRIGFEFTLSGNGVEGQEITRTTSTRCTKKSKLNATITALSSVKSITNLKSLIGTQCILLVIQKTSRQGVTFNEIDRILNSVDLK